MIRVIKEWNDRTIGISKIQKITSESVQGLKMLVKVNLKLMLNCTFAIWIPNLKYKEAFNKKQC